MLCTWRLLLLCHVVCLAPPADEDVAFKIVNREWEMQKKVGAPFQWASLAGKQSLAAPSPSPVVQHGFRASFDRGTLQLHFNFKRYRYRK